MYEVESHRVSSMLQGSLRIVYLKVATIESMGATTLLLFTPYVPSIAKPPLAKYQKHVAARGESRL